MKSSLRRIATDPAKLIASHDLLERRTRAQQRINRRNGSMHHARRMRYRPTASHRQRHVNAER